MGFSPVRMCCIGLVARRPTTAPGSAQLPEGCGGPFCLAVLQKTCPCCPAWPPQHIPLSQTPVCCKCEVLCPDTSPACLCSKIGELHKSTFASLVLQRLRETIELPPIKTPLCCAAGRPYLGSSPSVRASRAQAELESAREALRALTRQNAVPLQQLSASQAPSGGFALRQVLGGCADSAGLGCAATADSTPQRSANFRQTLCVPRLKRSRLTVQPCNSGCSGPCVAAAGLCRCWTTWPRRLTWLTLDVADCTAPWGCHLWLQKACLPCLLQTELTSSSPHVHCASPLPDTSSVWSLCRCRFQSEPQAPLSSPGHSLPPCPHSGLPLGSPRCCCPPGLR